MDDVNAVKTLEPVLDYSIRIVGSGSRSSASSSS